MKNEQVDPEELAKIRGLDDFDLIMLISEISDHGWSTARCTLCLMPPYDQQRYKRMQAIDPRAKAAKLC